MNLYEAFARNLREYCSKQESIAEVCRATGINRQQFARYLAGDSLPNPQNLRKICEVLRVEEWQLLHKAKPDQTHDVPAQEQLARAAANLFSGFEMLINYGNKTASKPVYTPGLYYQYSPMPNLEGFLMRSLLVVREATGGMSFQRLTRLRSAQHKFSLTRGKHAGIILPGPECDCMIGRNENPPYQITLVTMERWQAAADVHTGMMLSRTANNIMASRVVTQKLDNKVTMRKACAALGIVAATDPALPVAVDSLLHAFRESSPGFMLSPSEDVLMPIVAARESRHPQK